MQSRVLSDSASQRTIALVLSTGDEVMEGLLACAREHGLTGASFTAIGALEQVTLGYFEPQRREYKRIHLEEQVEVLTLAGNIALDDKGPKVHAHIVVGRSDASAYGGHLLDGRVKPTLEVILVETPAHLRRTIDPETGLALLDLPASE